MLKWRLVSAAAIIAILLGLLHLDFHYPLGATGIWLLPLLLVVSVLITGELLSFWQDRDDCPPKWAVTIGALVIVVAACMPMLGRALRAGAWNAVDLTPLEWTLVGTTAALLLVITTTLARYNGAGTSTAMLAHGLLALLYAGLLPSFLVHLRLFHDQQWGMGALLSLILIVKMSDTGAYFVGRAIGKHKLAPILSPGKTIEGVIGGLSAAIAAALICYAWLLPALVSQQLPGGQLWRWALYGVVVMVVGVVGDLTESVLKRDAQRKDSSTWLPGLGGVLDIFDSLLLAAPVAYFCWAFGLIGP